MTIQPDYYSILEITPSASEKDVADAFRRLTKLYHPDRHSNSKEYHKKYIKIVEAYSVLSNKEKRKNYDLETLGHSTINDPITNQILDTRISDGEPTKDTLPDYFSNEVENRADYYHEVGLSFMIANKYEKAISYFDLAIKHYPTKLFYWMNKSEALLKMNLINESLKCLDYCIRIEPNNIKVINSRNHILYLLRRSK